MKKFIFFILICSAVGAKSQYYQFTKTTDTYANITGGTMLVNTNWSYFSKLFKTPFPFKFFTSNIFDSIEVDNTGSIYFNNINNGYFETFRTVLNSRGNGLSPVSYVVSGTAPNRVLKIEYQNAGFLADLSLTDYINFQTWIYETSYIIEFRYGPNSVTLASYGGEMGPYVDLADPISPSSNYIVIEGDPANPKVNTTSFATSGSLTGTPTNGTVYRFTPSKNHTGFTPQQNVSMNVMHNRINIPAGLVIRQVKILNGCGQTVIQANGIADIDLQSLPHGIYLVNLKTDKGELNRKLVW